MPKVEFDFSAYIADRTRDFTGREWVFQAINDWLAKPEESRVFLLTGEPGSGKTAIAARLTQFSQGAASPPDGLTQLTPDFLSAVHFCSARDRRWINPHVFAESLAVQLAERYPAYAKALAEKSGDRQVRIEVEQQVQGVASGQVVGVVIKKLDVSGVPLPEDAFSRIVREPLEALFREDSDEQVVILVDALDESLLYSGEVGIVSLLAQADKLPAGVRFIVTSRREERVENEFLDAEGMFLSAAEFDERNQADLSRYVEARLSHDEALTTQAAELKPVQVQKLVAEITAKAAGNFQYVRFLLDAVAKGQRSLTELEGLPTGLDGLYYDSLGRVVKLGRKDWSKDYSPLMGVLSVAQTSLTLAQLEAFTGQSEEAIWERLGDLWQFIEEVEPEVEPREDRESEEGYEI